MPPNGGAANGWPQNRLALGIRSLDKTFGGQRALRSIDLDIAAGEIHAIIGHNGSGKSTLIKILAGYHIPDEGDSSISVHGEALQFGSPKSSRELGLRFVHQDLGLVGSMTLSDNLSLGVGSKAGGRPLNRRAERQDAKVRLERLGYDLDPDIPVDRLSESERTAVALARCLDNSIESRHIVVLDEVTSAMPRSEANRLFASVRRLADSGVTVLFVSHDLHEVLQVADKVTVLRNGSHFRTRAVGELTHQDLVQLVLGRSLPVTDRAAAARQIAPGPKPVLAAIAIAGERVHGVSFAVAAGRVLGVAGLAGSGREELADLVAGGRQRDGTIAADDQTVPPGNARAARAAGICYVPADRLRRALFTDRSVRENLTVSDLRPFWRRWRVSRAGERSEVGGWTEKLKIRTSGPEAGITTLSGGNQQKVVLARWLRAGPKVLILDEPTQGVDIGSSADIHGLVDRSAAAGVAVLICSTDAGDLARLCDDVLVMHSGVVVAELTGDDVTEERIEHEQLAAQAREAVT